MAVNATFNVRPQWTIERIAGLLMHALVLFLIFGTYYVIFVLTLLPQSAAQPARTVLLSLFYHVLVLMCLLSYARCVFTNPGATPLAFAHRSFDAGASPFAICRTCRVPKPPRSHHCSMCGMCVLKQDHHCPWINTCVGFRNQKFFFQFLSYTVLLCIVGGSIAVANIDWSLFSPPAMPMSTANPTRSHDILLPILQILTASTGVSLGLAVGLLFGFHCVLLARNQTTPENHHRGHNPYNLGSKLLNFEQVMGPFSLMWLLPVHSTPGNGVDFLVRGADGRPGLITDV